MDARAAKLAWLASLPDEQLAALEAQLAAKIDYRRARNRLKFYKPYAKQREFHAAGRDYRERLFLAGNQLGKTLCASAEVAIHLCGRYPAWWEGRVYDKEIRCWAAGETALATRDSIQKLLVGPPQQRENYGTGMIPADAIIDCQPARGVPYLLDSVTVRHGGGGDVQAGQSIILLKSYEQGREKFQADTIDLAWPDEECEEDIYTEMLTRTNASPNGMLMTTFTPLKGITKVVGRFLMPDKKDGAAKDRCVISMTIDDVEHYSAERKAQIIASYAEHEREARTLGKPALGEGAVFPVMESQVRIDPIPIDPSWAQINGLDFGWDHPFAAVNVAWNRDADIIYVTKCYREAKTTPPIHASALRRWGAWVPCAWPHDGYQHDKGSGAQLAQLYRDEGLKLLDEHATHAEGGYGVEAGIMEMLSRMQTGRLKVFSTCGEWFQEFGLYHRKKGLIVKERDDLMSATRIAVMMLRKARTRPAATGGRPSKGKRGGRPGGGKGWGQ